MAETCYMCGSGGKLTKDHIPPKNLFPKPRPSNLITVPCCHRCNNGFCKEDEYFRLAVSCLMNSNQTGKSVWLNNVVPSTIKDRRIGPMIDRFSRDLQPTSVQTAYGPVPAVIAAVEAIPIQRVLTRITMGLLTLTHPEVSIRDLKYEITPIDQFKLNNGCMTSVEQHYAYFERGNGVYRCWRAVADTDTSYGMWVHMFYDSAAFMVMHSRPEQKKAAD